MTTHSSTIGFPAMLSRIGLILAALFALSLGGVGSALAQTAAPAQGAVPVPSCEKPGDPPRALSTEAGREAAERQRNAWSNKMKTYVDCLKHFIDEQHAAAAPHIKAVQTTLDEYNQAIKTFNDVQAARQQ